MLNQHKTIRDNIAKYNKPNPLADFLIPFIGDKKDIAILDVGSGPYSVIGSYLNDVKIHIAHIDNQDFISFYQKYKFVPDIHVHKLDMENLPFISNAYDVVCCLNALDHTNKAEQAVKEMIRVCKPGGYVYIDCHLDQMNTGHKHKWNAQKDGTFTNGKDMFDLKDLGFKITFEDRVGEDRYNHIVAVLQK